MAEQYLRDLLNKGTIDPVNDILKHFENQTQKMWQLIAISK